MKFIGKRLAIIFVVVVLVLGITTGSRMYIEGKHRIENSGYQGKVISILGDSISTYEGYIPVDDGTNLAHRAKYPYKGNFKNVNKTWWMQLIDQLDAELGVNDSWAGSTVGNMIDGNNGDWGEDAAMASLTRIQNLGSNGTPDVILFYGGTNDLGFGAMLGAFSASTAPAEVDLTSTKWFSFADAYTTAIMRLQYFYPEAEIIAILPAHTKDYYTDERLDYFSEEMIEICDHYGVQWVDLRDCGLTVEMMPDGIHPNAEGMDYITNAVCKVLLANSGDEVKE